MSRTRYEDMLGTWANQTLQRTGASRFAQRQIERQGRLAPVADLCVRRNEGNMMRMREILRSLGLVVLAGCLFISLLWVNTMCMDEFASNFILSDRVQRLHRLTSGLLFLQTILTLALVCTLEMAMKKKRESGGRTACSGWESEWGGGSCSTAAKHDRASVLATTGDNYDPSSLERSGGLADEPSYLFWERSNGANCD